MRSKRESNHHFQSPPQDTFKGKGIITSPKDNHILISEQTIIAYLTKLLYGQQIIVQIFNKNFRDIMLDCDSNFTMTKDFALAIVSEGNAITCSVILLKRFKYDLLSSHMIGTFTIKHLTCSTGGVCLQERIKPYF
jgi:hypothetical protein